MLVIGFSIGGWIANALALRAGGRVRGLVLVNGAGIMVDGEPCADVFGLTPQELSALSYHDPARYGIAPAALSDAQKAGMAANMRTLAVYGRARDMGDPQLRARLADVRVPVLVVWGDSDRVVTPAYGRAVAESFPDARFELIAQCGHMPQIEQPARLQELVCDDGAEPAEPRPGAPCRGHCSRRGRRRTRARHGPGGRRTGHDSHARCPPRRKALPPVNRRRAAVAAALAIAAASVCSQPAAAAAAEAATAAATPIPACRRPPTPSRAR